MRKFKNTLPVSVTGPNFGDCNKTVILPEGNISVNIYVLSDSVRLEYLYLGQVYHCTIKLDVFKAFFEEVVE